MTSENLTITIHMVASLDGFIAKSDNSIEWFETSDAYDQGITLPGDGSFFNTVDCFVMGANTYEHAFALAENYGWPYGDKPVIVMTHRELPSLNDKIRFLTCDLRTLVETHLRTYYKNVWVAGGSLLSRDFLKQDLAHEIRITILPVILGEGLPFFNQIGVERSLHLLETTAYANGMVELCYRICW